MPHSAVNEIFYLPNHRNLVAFLSHHCLVERCLIRDKPEVERKVRVFKLVPVTFSINLIRSLLGVTFNYCEKILKPVFFILSQFPLIHRLELRLLAGHQTFPLLFIFRMLRILGSSLLVSICLQPYSLRPVFFLVF